MPSDENDDRDPEGTDQSGDDQDPLEPDDFDDRLAFYGRFRGWSEETDALASGGGYEALKAKLAADGRGSPEAAGLLAELKERERVAVEAEAEAERQRLASDREAAKEALRKELADQAVAEAAEAAEKRRRQELLDEIAAESSNGDQSTGSRPEAVAQKLLDESLEIVRDLNRPIEERAAAAERGIRASADLETLPFQPDRDALAAAAEAKLKKIRGA